MSQIWTNLHQNPSKFLSNWKIIIFNQLIIFMNHWSYSANLLFHYQIRLNAHFYFMFEYLIHFWNYLTTLSNLQMEILFSKFANYSRLCSFLNNFKHLWFIHLLGWNCYGCRFDLFYSNCSSLGMFDSLICLSFSFLIYYYLIRMKTSILYLIFHFNFHFQFLFYYH